MNHYTLVPDSWTATPEREALEREVAALIREHVGVGYELLPGGFADPDTIHVYAEGAAHMVVFRLLGPSK